MPRSKRAKKQSLTQTSKKGLTLKQKLIDEVRACAEKYDHIYTFSVKNMRNIHLKDVRSKWTDSKFFFGKNKVIIYALGKGPEDEHLDGLHQISKHLHGETGLLFTNRKKAEVLRFFEKYRAADFARSGDIVTNTIVLAPGPLSIEHCHSMEPQLRQLGLPTSLVKGVITLTQEHTVCKKGEKLTPEKGQILKLFGHQMAEFRIIVTGVWTKEIGDWETLKVSRKERTTKMDMEEDEEAEDDKEAEEEEEEEEDIMEI